MTTPITDELVREFLETKHPWEHRYDIWQRFLASKQAKDWEVVSFKNKNFGDDFEWALNKGGKYENNYCAEFTYDQLMYDKNAASVADGRMYINSVRRLSDNLMFAVGEVTQEGKIEKFTIEGNQLLVITDHNPFDTFFINDLHKLPEKVKLFTTEEGVSIYENGAYLFVSSSYEIHQDIAEPKKPQLWRTSLKNFSTRSAAEEYVFWNKPGISRKQIKDGLVEAGIDWQLCLNLINKQLNP